MVLTRCYAVRKCELKVFIELERISELGGVAEIVDAVVHAAQRLKAPPRSRSG